MRRLTLLLLSAALIGVAVPATYGAFSADTKSSGNSFAAAALFCTNPGTQTVLANADAWLDQGSVNSNKGTDTILKVKSGSGSSNARTIVRFTLPAIPASCEVTDARLRLYAASATNGRTLQARRVTAGVPANWVENTVTWANQPATSATDIATTTSGAGYRQWTVLAQVQAMYSPGANNGFLVRDATENSAASPEQQLHARDKGSDPPQLVVTFGG